ncbi:MAG: DUF4440 domain-containing protein [Acidobacteria bacterium]|nr:DUF4440 domain-containing protein [Acidobacteriota bacterium]
MNKPSHRLLPALVAVAAAAGVVAAGCASASPDPQEDLRAIEALNQHDVDAVLSGDFDALISQWTEDFVVITGGAIVRGRDANATLTEGARATAHLLEPVEHDLDFEETIVAGDYAFQWGTVRSSSRAVETGEVYSSSGKLLRILQRQPDGSWKMHRTMTVPDASNE